MRKTIYIAHAISGDVENNIEKVKKIVRDLNLKKEVHPFAPYLVDLMVLNDDDFKEREIGFSNNKIFFDKGVIDEVWCFGKISKGMSIEIQWAKDLKINVKYF